MKSEVFVCKICDEEYNKGERTPKILPRCGHTACASCLTKVVASIGKITCPVDNVVFMPQDKDINNFITNMSILEALDATQVVEEQLCETHQAPNDFVCITDKIRICEQCAQTTHKGHRIDDMNEFIGNATLKRRQMETQVKKFDKGQQDAQKILQQEKDAILKAFSDRFEKLHTALTNKEQQIKKEIDFAYALEKSKSKTSLEKKLELKEALQVGVDSIKKLTLDEIFFEHIINDLDTTHPTHDNEFITQGTTEINRQLTLTVEGFEAFLSKEIENFNPTFPDSKHIEAIGGFEPINSDMLNLMRIRRLLRFEDRFGCLIITPNDTPQNPEDITLMPLDPEEWMYVTRVGLEFHRRNLTQEMIQTISLLWNLLGEVTHLKIDLSNKEMNDAELLKFCSDSFWATKSVQVFELNLKGCHVSEDTLKHVLNGVISKMENLTSLDLRLAETNITDETILAFAKDIQPLMPKIETFRLNLQNTAVTDASVSQLFAPMPNVHIFAVNLNNTRIGDYSMEALARNSLSTMEHLEHFELYLFSTKITNHGLVYIFGDLPNVKKYVLSITNTSITDESLEAFARNALPSMTQLETLELYLSDTEITDYGAIQIFGSMETLRNFVLGLSSTKITDLCMQTFANQTLSSFKVLETFELYLLNNNITDLGICQLFIAMETLKKFKLALSYTDITDLSLETFAAQMLPSMRNLESLELYLARTEITDEGVIQIFPHMKPIRHFILDLNETDVTDESLEVFNQYLPEMTNLSSFEIQVEETDVSDEGRNMLTTFKQKFSH